MANTARAEGPLRESLRFSSAHPLPVAACSLVAALGRVIQVGGLGEIGAASSWLLELVVEPARIALFLIVVGDGRVMEGVARLRRARASGVDSVLTQALATLRREWQRYGKSFAAFVLIAIAGNLIIAALARTLGAPGSPLPFPEAATPQGRELSIELGLKNLSLIPLTIIYLTLLVREAARRGA